LLLGAGACFGDHATPWDTAVAVSLDAPPVPPSSQPSDPFPSTCTTFGTWVATANPPYNQFDVSCYIHADLPAVWNAIKDPTTTEDSHTTDFSVANVYDPVPQHVIHQLIHYDLVDIISLWYQLEWVHVVDQGTFDQPTHLVITFQKTDGSDLITLLADSFDLTSPAPGVTLLSISEHCNAYRTSLSDIHNVVLGYYANIAKYVNAPYTLPP
jgi:hypothetical protein